MLFKKLFMFKKIFIAVFVFTAICNNLFAKNLQPLIDSTVTIKVKGVTCSNDLKTLSTNVKELKGVSECKPGKAGAVSVFKVTYNPAVVNIKDIHKAFENTGGCSDPNDRPYKIKN
jgi:copper chaperone CopZ